MDVGRDMQPCLDLIAALHKLEESRAQRANAVIQKAKSMARFGSPTIGRDVSDRRPLVASQSAGTGRKSSSYGVSCDRPRELSGFRRVMRCGNAICVQREA